MVAALAALDLEPAMPDLMAVVVAVLALMVMPYRRLVLEHLDKASMAVKMALLQPHLAAAVAALVVSVVLVVLIMSDNMKVDMAGPAGL
jgi:hypothetical protein